MKRIIVNFLIRVVLKTINDPKNPNIALTIKENKDAKIQLLNETGGFSLEAEKWISENSPVEKR